MDITINHLPSLEYGVIFRSSLEAVVNLFYLINEL